MTAATAVPQRGVPASADIALAGGGTAAIGGFVAVSLRHPSPIIRPRLIVESRFLRSSVAVFPQMFCLAAVLVATPLYIVRSLGGGVVLAGVAVFALPATMAAAAPLVGLACERASPRWILRAGLALLAVAVIGLGAFLARRGTSLGGLVAILVAVGGGVALVQTPAAAGATQSPAGAAGAALGLFNMGRFAGSAVGTAWVALLYPHAAFGLLFEGCAVMAGAGLLLSFAGPDPAMPQPAAEPVSAA